MAFEFIKQFFAPEEPVKVSVEVRALGEEQAELTNAIISQPGQHKAVDATVSVVTTVDRGVRIGTTNAVIDSPDAHLTVNATVEVTILSEEEYRDVTLANTCAYTKPEEVIDAINNSRGYLEWELGNPLPDAEFRKMLSPGEQKVFNTWMTPKK